MSSSLADGVSGFALVGDAETIQRLALAKDDVPLFGVWLAEDVVSIAHNDNDGAAREVGLVHTRKSFSLDELARSPDLLLMKKWMETRHLDTGVLLLVNQVDRGDNKGGWRAIPLLFKGNSGSFMQGMIDVNPTATLYPPTLDSVRERLQQVVLSNSRPGAPANHIASNLLQVEGVPKVKETVWNARQEGDVEGEAHTPNSRKAPTIKIAVADIEQHSLEHSTEGRLSVSQRRLQFERASPAARIIIHQDERQESPTRGPTRLVSGPSVQINSSVDSAPSQDTVSTGLGSGEMTGLSDAHGRTKPPTLPAPPPPPPPPPPLPESDTLLNQTPSRAGLVPIKPKPSPPPKPHPLALARQIRFGYLRKPDKLGFWVARMVVFDSQQRSLIYASFDRSGALTPPEHIMFERVTRVQLSVYSSRQFEVDEDCSERFDLGQRPTRSPVVTHAFLCDDEEDAREWVKLVHAAAPRLAEEAPPPPKPTKPMGLMPQQRPTIPPRPTHASEPIFAQPRPKRSPIAARSVPINQTERNFASKSVTSVPQQRYSSTPVGRDPPKMAPKLPAQAWSDHLSLESGQRQSGADRLNGPIRKRVPPPPPEAQRHSPRHPETLFVQPQGLPSGSSSAVSPLRSGTKIPPPPPPHPHSSSKIPPPPPPHPSVQPSPSKIPPPPPPATNSRVPPPPPPQPLSPSRVPPPPPPPLASPVTLSTGYPGGTASYKVPPPALPPSNMSVSTRRTSVGDSSSKPTIHNGPRLDRVPERQNVDLARSATRGGAQRRRTGEADYEMLRHIHSAEITRSATTTHNGQVPVWMLPRSSRPREAPPPPPRTTRPGFYNGIGPVAGL